MADFNHYGAYDAVQQHEGGYIDDPYDRGGETYAGISRRFHPYWPGWGQIDDMKKTSTPPKDWGMWHHVYSFFKDNYWDAIRGDEINTQEIANKLLDIAVNMGRRTAIEFLQRSLNLLNRNGESWEDLVEDGWIGRKTISVLNAVTSEDPKHRDTHCALVLLNGHQIKRYMHIMRRSPTQERFARGWLLRIKLPI